MQTAHQLDKRRTMPTSTWITIEAQDRASRERTNRACHPSAQGHARDCCILGTRYSFRTFLRSRGGLQNSAGRYVTEQHTQRLQGNPGLLTSTGNRGNRSSAQGRAGTLFSGSPPTLPDAEQIQDLRRHLCLAFPHLLSSAPGAASSCLNQTPHAGVRPVLQPGRPKP